MAVTDAETIRQLTEALSNLRASSKKPDLPAFDEKNIDLWIKRVDNAYRRAGISDPKDKFAFLETKFPVDVDARINAFIFGDGTQQSWDSFQAYLRERYGRSKQQRAAVVLDGVKRDGRKPSQMFASIMEQIGDLSVDDLVKEMVIRELPTDLQRVIHDKAKDLAGMATSELADQYFDKDGRVLHKGAPSTVSHVYNVPDIVDTSDEEDNDVHAVDARAKKFPPRNNQRPANRPRSSNDGNNFGRRADVPPKPAFSRPFTSNDSGRNFSSTTAPRPNVKKPRLCHYHLKFQDRAQKCEPGCEKYPTFNPNGRAGRQT